ncbi:anthranilate 1,2-dioxygenase regulatory protein AndR [Paraburkholderia sp.]|uniref:anthranilate 1,2-dioxygenase regulatory protein AndR n=1 Tax=Paraburkholderia sp. TaxID=1926495 RepID=UPI0023876CC6|nr:anthranilate 1,2-dioxygenase regulatory protein AndR [Paraburkholderia sp.]MDE1180479.1 AraC family transcriptional regulator [Paraburkholderia sp.]
MSERAFFRPDALRGHRLFESSDLDETRELISRVMQPHSLTPSGTGRGRSHMDFVKLGRLGMGTIAFGDAMRVDVEAVDGYYLMMFCVAGEAQVRTMDCSVIVNTERGVLCAPGEHFDAVLSPGCEQFILRIDPAAFVARRLMEERRFSPVVPLANAPLRGWMQQLQAVAGSTDLLDSARDNPQIAAHVEGLLIDLLALGHLETPGGTRSNVLAPAFVRRAEDFVLANLAGRLQLTDIATAIGVPVRTLTDGFQHFRGITPMQYVRQARLERAREALRLAGPDARVAEIALDCGFTHLGRFALEYKRKFGESPSETQRKR